MLKSNWDSSDHCRHRAQEEIRKAVTAPLGWLRVHHLEAAFEWIDRGNRLGDAGPWDGLGPPAQSRPLAASNDASPVETSATCAPTEREAQNDDRTILSFRPRRTA